MKSSELETAANLKLPTSSSTQDNADGAGASQAVEESRIQDEPRNPSTTNFIEEELHAADRPTDSPKFAPPEFGRRASGHWLKTKHQPTFLATLVIAILLCLHTLYITRAASFPLIVAVLLSLPLRPVVRFFREQLRLPDFFGALLCVGLLLTLCAGSLYWLAGPAKRWVREAPASFRQVEKKLAGIVESVEEFEQASQQIEKMTRPEEDQARNTRSAVEGGTMQVEIKPRSFTSTILDTTSNVLAGISIAIGMTFLVLAFGDNLQRAIIGMLPDYPDQRNVLEMVEEIEGTISDYLLTYTCINIVLGIVMAIVMWLLGLPNPILWGVMACLLNYIPFIGLLVGTAVVGIVALVTFDSVGYALVAPSLYLAINGIEANAITPAVLGQRMQLNVIIIFVSIVMLGWMWGVGGAIIAVPVLALVKITCDYFQPLQPIGKLLGAAD